jgi:hypothetical protein
MPRAIDLSAAPPPQAVCYACDHQVTLDRRARGRGRFRCPVCHADNRVDPSGVGQPLHRDGHRVESMPLTRCPGCATANRLPAPLLKRGGYTCHACGGVNPVPRVLRRRAGIVPWWIPALLIGVTALAGARGWRDVRVFAAQVREGALQRGLAATSESLSFEDHRAEQGPYGARYVVGARLTNLMRRTATLYVRVELRAGGAVVLQRTVALVAVRPGERRSFRAVFDDPAFRRIDSATLHLYGLS